jgi:Lar family restriction alleviation protein
MSDNLKPCPFCGGEAVVKCICDAGRPDTDDWWVSCSGCRVERPSTRKSEIVHSRDEAIAAWNRRAGSWQPVAHDDPYNDGPVWVDENGCVCWAGANGETRRLVLHGDMRLCLFVEAAT